MESKCGGRVAGQGLQVADRLTALGEEREAAMPEVVEADRGDARSLE